MLKAFLLIILGLAAAAIGGPAARADFYDATPQEMKGPTGSLIRYQVMDDAPSGAVAYRILYRSIGLRGEPIAVSGMVIRPLGKPPTYGRGVVAWAHGTSGIAQPCAPSIYGLQVDAIPALSLLLKRGYLVVATDYPGLGTGTQHPYLVGDSEGRAVLDSVKAARTIPDAHANNQFVVWGHSQGGHAALFAGQLAPRYAPELQLMGVAAIAPATDLALLFENDLNSPAGVILTTLALSSWAKVFEAPIASMVAAPQRPEVEKIAKGCILDIFALLVDFASQKRLQKTFLLADPGTTLPWSNFMAVNSPGHTRAGAPLFIAQGASDAVVDPPVTDAYVAATCARGTRVRYVRYPKASHHTVVRQSAIVVVDWMAERFNDAPVRTPCGE